MRLALAVDLGNEAMQSPRDVLRAVEGAMDRHADDCGVSLSFATFTPGDSGRLMDENGNTVGEWTVTA